MSRGRSRLLAAYLFGIVATTLLLTSIDATLTEDKELTASLRASWYDPEFSVVLRNIRTRKKHGTEAEPLLVVRYGESNRKTILMLDRRTREVILENLDTKGRRTARRITLESLNRAHEHTHIKSLILSIRQKQPDARLDVYVDCIYQGSIDLEKSFRELADEEEFLSFEAFRENRSKVRVYRSTPFEKVLKSEECPEEALAVTDRPRDRSTFDGDDFDTLDNVESDKKRESPFSSGHGSTFPFGLDYSFERSNLSLEATIAKRRTPRRGDIGIQSLDEKICLTEGQIAKTLNELIQATRKVWVELEANRRETHELRVLMENCAACREGTIGA